MYYKFYIKTESEISSLPIKIQLTKLYYFVSTTPIRANLSSVPIYHNKLYVGILCVTCSEWFYIEPLEILSS